MATLNLERVGRPLAVVEGGVLKGKLVCVADEIERNQVKHKFKKIDLTVGVRESLINKELVYYARLVALLEARAVALSRHAYARRRRRQRRRRRRRRAARNNTQQSPCSVM
jgi:hypothetical protein